MVPFSIAIQWSIVVVIDGDDCEVDNNNDGMLTPRSIT